MIIDGLMEIKRQNKKTWQKRYFALRNKKLCHCKPENKNKLNKYDCIDLREIEEITVNPSNSQYIENDTIYYEFHLKESNCLWQLRVNTEKKKKVWTDCIVNEYQKLVLTLVRYKQILNEIKLYHFLSRPYTINDIIEDHIHVMRYHNNVDFSAIFGLQDCNKKECSSWIRFNSSKKVSLYQTKHKYGGEENDEDNEIHKFFHFHDEENTLQSIFDNIHCYIYHSLDRRQRLEQISGFNRPEISPLKLIKSMSEMVADDSAEDGEDNEFTVQDVQQLSHIYDDDEMRNIGEADDAENKYPENEYEDRATFSSCISFQQKPSSMQYENYNIIKYLCKSEKFPLEYQGGIKMYYHQDGPGQKSLKHEIKAWVDDEQFQCILEKCKKTMQSQHAYGHTCNSNNDHYGMRFGHCMGIEHVVSLYIYCSMWNLCCEFGKTFRRDPFETEHDVKKKHLRRFYWFGRFLYEGEFMFVYFISF